MKKFLKNNSTCFIKLETLNVNLAPSEVYQIPEDRMGEFSKDIDLLVAVRYDKIRVGWWEDSYYTDNKKGEVYLRSLFGNDSYIIDGTNIIEFTPAIIEDLETGLIGESTFVNMQTLSRELYNDPTSEFYVSDFIPMLGVEGTQQERDERILNLEVIHNKTGWHNRQLMQSIYQKPDDLLIFYGWMNSFNSAENGWDNELVSHDMAKYKYIVLGNGIAEPTHGDYANTTQIIDRIKTISPNTKIFGYVTNNQSVNDFKTEVDKWVALQLYGMFIDEAGYDSGVGREEFNEKIDYVHAQTWNNKCFVNSWVITHIIGIEDDPTYPNTTWNPNLIESNLTYDDYCLIESLAVNTDSYAANDGYELRTDWIDRIQMATDNRYTYGINLIACCIINNDNPNGQDLFDFAFNSALMGSLEGFGTSDTSYASSSSAVTYWDRPNTINLGITCDFSPIIEQDGDVDVYRRKLQFGELKLDFSISSQNSEIVYYSSQSISAMESTSTIISLDDTPISYDDGKVLTSTTNGTEWVTPSGGGSSDLMPFMAIESSGDISILSSDTIIVIDSITTSHANYSLASNGVEVGSIGIYEISYTAVLDCTNTTGSTRGGITSWLTNNGTIINGSHGRCYIRETSGGDAINGGCIVSLSTNDIIVIHAQITNGSSTADTVQNYSSIRFKKVG